MNIVLTIACLLIFALGACAPTVRVATPEPLKLDVKMRVDVYSKGNPQKKKQEDTQFQVATQRRARMAEVQSLKNDRVVGENREGYLEVRNIPADPKYAEYTKNTVGAENNDRAVIYVANAQTESKPVELVQRDYAQLWRDRAFPGEWIQKDDGTWIQK
jgi:uncharacterized protein